MVEKQIMFHQEDYSVEVDVAALTPWEKSRIEAYTKSKSSQGNFINRNFFFIAIEPFNCHPLQGEKMRRAIQERKVSYASRSIVPSAVCMPNSVVGIQACLRAASEQKYEFNSISVIGGGHSANCIGQDALAVDMRYWKKVEVYPKEMVVCAGGGATCGKITRAAETEGLLVPLGDRPGVGIGLILAGGINHYMRKFGLAIDNIIRLVYVSPCGQLLVAEGEELLMRFRGAGSNFGVVLEVMLRAHPIGTITKQCVQYSFHEWCSTSNILGSYSSYAIGRELSESIDSFLFYKADELVFATSHFHLAEKDEQCYFVEGNLFLDHPCLKSLTRNAVMSHLMPSELYDLELYMTEPFYMQSATTKVYPKGCKLRSVKRCLFFQTLQGKIETELIKSMKSVPTMWCYLHILHGGGKVKEVAPCSTSFCAREWNFAVVITGRWPDGDEILHSQTNAWMKLTTDGLIPYTVGIYSTDLGPGDYQLTHLAYEKHNLICLGELKRKHDPQMLLRHSCPLINQSESSIADSLGQSRGVVIIVGGKRHSGKDWLGNIIKAQLGNLLGEQGKSLVNMVSISEGTKLAYAKEVGLDGDLLLRSRKYKEQHRSGLSQFYKKKKALDTAFDRKCFVELVQKYSNGGILIVTGMRDGLDYAKLLSGRPTLFVLLKSDDESKTRRGWNGYIEGIDDTIGEMLDQFVCPNLVYNNDRKSTTAKASSWVMKELAPAIVKACIREIKNVPKPGIIYRDIIGGLLVQPFGVSLVTSLITSHLATSLKEDHVDAVLAPEALGFSLAGQIASVFCLPLILARKVKPVFGYFHETSSTGSNMSNLSKSSEETNNKHNFYMQPTILPGQRVLVVDDCIATGATLNALAQLVSSQGGSIVKLVTLMEMVHPELNGSRMALERGIGVFSLTSFEGK
ncbi:hypothetical protein ACHAWX_005296 [Stephanocyclus meneghinianus]